MLLRENLEKLLVKNWTSYVDVHLLTAFVKDVVQKNAFGQSDVPDGVFYPSDTLRIKVSGIRLVGGLEVTINFTAPQGNGVVVGEMELLLSPEATVKTLNGRWIKKTLRPTS